MRSIEVKDVIDILLLSCVLFFIYNLIRDSRAWKLIIGLLVMLLMSVVAEIFDMSALGFILGNFQQLGLIAIIVLFQPEFRTALEKVGGTPLTGIKSIATSSEELAAINADIEAICTAVGDLSRDKTAESSFRRQQRRLRKRHSRNLAQIYKFDFYEVNEYELP